MKTDAAKHLIEVKTVDFGGSPRFKEDGTEYVPDDGEEHEAYVGTPRREIDHNWALLHWGEFLVSFPLSPVSVVSELSFSGGPLLTVANCCCGKRPVLPLDRR